MTSLHKFTVLSLQATQIFATPNVNIFLNISTGGQKRKASMKPELSKVSLGLKILTVVLIIICIGLGSHIIDGGVKRGPLEHLSAVRV